MRKKQKYENIEIDAHGDGTCSFDTETDNHSLLMAGCRAQKSADIPLKFASVWHAYPTELTQKEWVAYA